MAAILNDAAIGQLKPRYDGNYRVPYRNDPAPRRDLLPRGQFLTTSSLIATRGCHSRCDFCYLSTDGLQMPYHLRDAKQIADEFAADNQSYAVFVDNNLGSRPEYLRELCQTLRPLEKIWSAAVSIDVTDDPTVIREMALCRMHGSSSWALEIPAPGQRSPTQARKVRDPTISARVAIFRDNGIQVNGSFVLGFDHDRIDVFEQTVEWIESNRLECATFHILTPYPGTPLFARMESEGRILHKDWSRYDTCTWSFNRST